MVDINSNCRSQGQILTLGFLILRMGNLVLAINPSLQFKDRIVTARLSSVA